MHQNVAELSGRTSRWIRGEIDAAGNSSFHKRTRRRDATLDERKAFQDGRKKVAIVTDAASAGISLHADRDCANTSRRVMLVLELPWKAEVLAQLVGRVRLSTYDDFKFRPFRFSGT